MLDRSLLTKTELFLITTPARNDVDPRAHRLVVAELGRRLDVELLCLEAMGGDIVGCRMPDWMLNANDAHQNVVENLLRIITTARKKNEEYLKNFSGNIY